MGWAEVFGKKKEEVKTETAPQIPTFEIGKEVQTKDPKTGEFIYQRAISPEQRKELFTLMNKNGQTAQQFVVQCRQFVGVLKTVLGGSDAIDASEKEINTCIEKIRDEMKLDRRWGFNMQLGVLERRDPPDA